MSIPILRTADRAFESHFARLERRARGEDGPVDQIERTVREIVADVRMRKDAALIDHSRRLDARPDLTAEMLEVKPSEIERARSRISVELAGALVRAHERIRAFHATQVGALGEVVLVLEGVTTRLSARALDRVGLYVPGGRARYPSTVLMNAVPAKIAGVNQIVMVTPAQGGVVPDVVLAAAHIAGVDRVFTVGGAQAIAALAFGTETIPRVDKIVGPGNAYVAEAKRQVFGHVAIDQIAGPSEVVILADESASAKTVAADLLAQAEHDPASASIAITWSEAVADGIRREVEDQLVDLPRASTAREAIKSQGAVIVARDLTEALALANRYAPEHLGLAIEDSRRHVGAIRNAGAVFVGHYTTEALGDYNAGTNHVLPTSGTARYASPLSVHDFVKRTSVLEVDREGLGALADDAAALARAEGLEAHARAVEIRRGGWHS